MPVSRARAASGTWSSTCSRSTRHRSSASISHLHSAVPAGGEGLLVPVEGGTAPTDQPGGVLGGAALGAGVGGDGELVGDHRRIRCWAAEPGPVLPGGGDPAVTRSTINSRSYSAR